MVRDADRAGERLDTPLARVSHCRLTNVSLIQHIGRVDSARCDKCTQYAVRTLSVTKDVAKVRNIPE